MKSQFYFFIFSIILILSSCKNANDQKQNITIELSEVEQEIGFGLLQQNCFSCHHPDPSFKNRIAPSFADIKDAYKNESPSTMVSFLKEPKPKHSKMLDAIEKFGVMPVLSYSDEELTAVAKYIFTKEIGSQEWFEKDFVEEKNKLAASSTKLTPLQQGKEFAMKTKSTLGKNLLNAIKTKGTEGAVEFCSTKAIPLTDSMAVALNAKIKRVSDKNRNPNNYANDNELKYINSAKDALANGEEVKPVIFNRDSTFVGYYPIVTNTMCLQCHGQQGSQITDATYKMIHESYPDDKATGYGENELRGIWVVEFDQ